MRVRFGIDRSSLAPRGVHGNVFDEDVKLFVRNFKKNVVEKLKSMLCAVLRSQ